jgi:hypothetical protein
MSLQVYAQHYPELKSQIRIIAPGNEIPVSLLKGEGQSFFLLGSIDQKGGKIKDSYGCTDMWIANIHLNGEIIWQKTIGGPFCDVPSHLSWQNGVICISGSSASLIDHPEAIDRYRSGDAVFARISPDGRLLSYVTSGETGQDYATQSVSITDSVLIQTGWYDSQIALTPAKNGKSDIWIRSYGEDTISRWEKGAGGDGLDWPVAISKIGKEWIIAANTCPVIENADALCSPWIIWGDINGIIKGNQLLKVKPGVTLTSMTTNFQGQVLLAGKRRNELGNDQFWWALSDKVGNIIQEWEYGGSGNEYITGVTALARGGWAMTGTSCYYNLENEYIKGGEDLWVFRLDNTGAPEWKRTFGGSRNEKSTTILELSPGKLLVGGTRAVNASDTADTDIWLLEIQEYPCQLPQANPSWTFLEEDSTKIQFYAGAPEGSDVIWDFGEGKISAALNPLIQFPASGKYEVRLQIKSGEYCNKWYLVQPDILIE